MKKSILIILLMFCSGCMVIGPSQMPKKPTKPNVDTVYIGYDRICFKLDEVDLEKLTIDKDAVPLMLEEETTCFFKEDMAELFIYIRNLERGYD